jgi:hypothetical protein
MKWWFYHIHDISRDIIYLCLRFDIKYILPPPPPRPASTYRRSASIRPEYDEFISFTPLLSHISSHFYLFIFILHFECCCLSLIFAATPPQPSSLVEKFHFIPYTDVSLFLFWWFPHAILGFISMLANTRSFISTIRIFDHFTSVSRFRVAWFLIAIDSFALASLTISIFGRNFS